MNIRKKQKGFTLAEVLITLTILGVVAAITVPNLIRNYQKKVTVTKLAKAYATLQDAATNIKYSTSCENVECLKSRGWTQSLSGDIFTTEMQSIFANTSGLGPQSIKEINGAPWIKPKFLHCENKPNCDDSTNMYGQVIMKDGIWYQASFTTFPTTRIDIVVGTEVNNKGEYMLGRNIFHFMIYNNFEVEPRVYTAGGIGPASKVSKEKIYERCNPDNVITTQGGSGNSCAARIILDGWKMKY